MQVCFNPVGVDDRTVAAVPGGVEDMGNCVLAGALFKRITRQSIDGVRLPANRWLARRVRHAVIDI